MIFISNVLGKSTNWDLQDQGVIDSGCSRHMTGKRPILMTMKEYDGGYVAFGGNPQKRENHMEKLWTIKTDNLDFGIYDYSRFTWVFFLATKDETSDILKSFITGIENLVDHNVKLETPKINRVAERRIGHLIEVKLERRTDLVVTCQRLYFCYHSLLLIQPYYQDPRVLMMMDSKTVSMMLENKVEDDPRKDSECKDQEKEDNINNTNNVNIAGNAAGTNEVNSVGGKTRIELPFDSNMPALEDNSIFDFSSDDEDDGAMADMNNLDITIQSKFIVMISSFGLTKERRLCIDLKKLMHEKFSDEFYWENLHSYWGLQSEAEEGCIIIYQDKYVAGNFNGNLGEFIEVKTASTPMETQKLLLKDKDGEEYDVHMYRLVIGSLMYLNLPRPDLDIMFCCVCCARY
ncbi:hypothetical protein Tco_0840303 [Tanacetum coccineum]|uniref:Uncharacterized protein n=1 Tax=Tanacetum coccineum TaxID=301880 RepID=A0ABQ5AT50_9ASTR